MKEHTGKNKIFIVIIICLCAVIIAGLIYFMKLKGGSDSAFKPDLDSNAKTQTADDTGEKPTGIRIPGYPTITIEADKKDVQMNLMNPEGNPCYFTFEIVLNDTGETIYTSKMVEPGKAITEVTLDKALAAENIRRPSRLRPRHSLTALHERGKCRDYINCTVTGETVRKLG